MAKSDNKCKSCENPPMRLGKWCKEHSPRCINDECDKFVRRENVLCKDHKVAEEKNTTFEPLVDKRVMVEKRVLLKSMDEIRAAVKEGFPIVIRSGEDFSEYISWYEWEQMVYGDDFVISEDGWSGDSHNDGGDVLRITDYDSYSYAQGNGIFRRRQFHEHLVEVCKIVPVLQKLVIHNDNGSYIVAGHQMSEDEFRKRMNIVL